MRILPAFLFTTAILAGHAALAQVAPVDFRTWTDSRGRQAEMAFVDFVDGKLRMKNHDDQEFTLALEQLSAADRDFLLNAQIEQALTWNSEGRRDDALALLRTVAQVDHTYGPAFLWMGNIHAQQEDWDEAIAAYKTLADLKPKDPEGSRGVARIYAQIGKTDLAKFWYQRALEIDPQNATLKAELAELDKPATAPPPVSPPETSSPPPANAAPTTEQDNQTQEDVGFWQQGLVGILGGRTVWWGRAIAIFLFAFAIFGGLIQNRATYNAMRKAGTLQSRGQAGCSAFGGAVLGFAFLYVLYWGIPSGIQWAIALPLILIVSAMAASAASSSTPADSPD